MRSDHWSALDTHLVVDQLDAARRELQMRREERMHAQRVLDQTRVKEARAGEQLQALLDARRGQ